MNPTRRNLLVRACCAGAALAAGFVVKSGAPKPAPPGADAAQWARERFLTHWNCTQAVVEAVSGQLIDPQALLRLSTGFAAGMWNGMACGAVTGAVMALSLRLGRESQGDSAAVERTATVLRAYMEAMRARHPDLGCSALLGVDMSTKAGVELAASRGLFTSRCADIVAQCAGQAARQLG